MCQRIAAPCIMVPDIDISWPTHSSRKFRCCSATKVDGAPDDTATDASCGPATPGPAGPGTSSPARSPSARGPASARRS